MDKWDRLYCLMRIMDLSIGQATKIANIGTGECLDYPDEKVIAEKAKDYLKTMDKGQNLISFLGIKFDQPKTDKAKPTFEPPEVSNN